MKLLFYSKKSSLDLGFTMTELLIIIIILGILAAVSYPLFKAYRPGLTAKGGARQVETLMAKARVRAFNQKKPIRVVINCSHPGGFESCFMDLQSAAYNNHDVTGWLRQAGDHQVLDRNLMVAKLKSPSTHDGEVSVKDIYWAVFMPAGQVFSDPRPTSLLVYHQTQKNPDKFGWKISVNNDTGRVALVQGQFNVP
jgi:prepilin-type N-terminal cleavage/methylation domain-containing protein